MPMLPASQQLPSTGSLLLAAACLWLVHILTLQCCHPCAEPKHCLGLFALRAATGSAWPPQRGTAGLAPMGTIRCRPAPGYTSLNAHPCRTACGALSCRHLHMQVLTGVVTPFSLQECWMRTIVHSALVCALLRCPLAGACPAVSVQWLSLATLCCRALLEQCARASVLSCIVSLLAAALLICVLALTGKVTECRSAGHSVSPATAPSCTPPCWMSSRLWRRSWTRSRGRPGMTSTSPLTPSLPPAAALHQRRCELTGEAAGLFCAAAFERSSVLLPCEWTGRRLSILRSMCSISCRHRCRT